MPPNIRAVLELRSADVDKMYAMICHRMKTIFSLAHALAFRTDPLFDNLRDNLFKLHWEAFLNLGDLIILQQCKTAIKRIVAADVMLNRTMQSEFDLYIFRVANNDDDFADIYAATHVGVG